MRIPLRTAPFVLLASAPAAAQVEGVVKSAELNSNTIIQFLFGVVLALIALTWRTHKSEYGEFKKKMDSELSEVYRLLDNSLHKDALTNMQTSIHQSLETLKNDINRWRTDDSNSSIRIINELWEEIKDQRSEARNISSEVWKQIETHRERLTQFELGLARSYHTKQEISQLLDDKIDPLMEAVKKLQPSSEYHGPRRRSADN